MRIIRNQKGFIAYIPLAICLIFALYILGMLAWSKVETYLWHRQARMEERARQDADIEGKRIEAEKAMEGKRIALQDKQLETVMGQNARLIEEQAKTADRIAEAHERAAGEITETNEKMVNMLLTWAKEGPQATDKTILYLLGIIALTAVLGLVAALFFLLRGRRYPEGPIVLSVEGGHQVNGRIATGQDVIQLLEHRKEIHR